MLLLLLRFRSPDFCGDAYAFFLEFEFGRFFDSSNGGTLSFLSSRMLARLLEPVYLAGLLSVGMEWPSVLPLSVTSSSLPSWLVS